MYSGDSNNVKEALRKALPGSLIEVRVEDLGAYINERISAGIAATENKYSID